MKITMYELLGLVKDGKVPVRIIYDKYVYVWNSKIENYQREIDEITTLNWDYIAINCLNEPVEILEENKIPEKLDHLIGYDIKQFDDLKEYVEITTNDLFGKINKVIDTLDNLIDYLKSKGE